MSKWTKQLFNLEQFMIIILFHITLHPKDFVVFIPLDCEWWNQRRIFCNLKGQFLKPNEQICCVWKRQTKNHVYQKWQYFTIEQKRFIVKTFGRNPLPASVRREFLLYFKITERDASKLHDQLFSIANSSFDQNDHIFRKNWTASSKPPKRSKEKFE